MFGTWYCASQEIEFIFDLSLGFIAFAAGSELFFKEIKGTFNSIKWNTISSILTTFTVGFVLVFLIFNTLNYFDNIQLDIKIYLSLLKVIWYFPRPNFLYSFW